MARTSPQSISTFRPTRTPLRAQTTNALATPKPVATSPTTVTATSTATAEALVLGMSAEDARRRTLAQLDPRSEPEITSVILATADAIAKEFLWLGSGGIQGELDDSDYWYVVAVRIAHLDLLGTSANRDPRPYARYIALFNAETAEQHSSFGLPSSRKKDGLSLDRVPTAFIRPRIVPAPTPSPPSYHRWPWPWGRSEPNEPIAQTNDLSGAGPSINLLNLSPTLKAVLRSYPLLPGNSWTYRQDVYEHSRWQGAIYTETVQSLESLTPDLSLVILERQENSLGPAVWSRTYSTYILIWRDEIYPEDNPDRIREWIEYFSSNPNVATAAPNFQFAENHELTGEGRPAPALRLPLRVGSEIPVANTGDNWKVEKPQSMDTKAGTFSKCFKASHSGNYAGWKWFCDGAGPVRKERLKAGSTGVISTIVLQSINLPARVE